MVASEVHLIRESSRELYFAHRPLAGLAFMLIGMGIVYYLSFSGRVSDPAARWLLSAGGAFFALIGTGAALWRYELRLDLLTRSYSGRRGFWPNPKTLRGSLDELEGAVLTSRIDRSDKSTTTVWTVSLAFRTWDKPVKVMESQNEVSAHQALEHYARMLGVAAIDRSGTEEQRTAGPDLDRPLADQPGRAIFIPPLPAGSGIEFLNRPGRRSITLPPAGFSAGLFIIIFGLPFFGMGSLFLWMLLSGRPVSGSILAVSIIAPVFMLIGIFIVFLGIAAMWGRQLIEEEGIEVVHCLVLFGKRIRSTRIPKQEVEEVSIKPAPNRRNNKQQGLVIRSDKKIIRVSEQKMSGQDMEWLKLAVQNLVSGR